VGGYKLNKPINDFSQQHISGMGGPTLAQFSLMPATGEFSFTRCHFPATSQTHSS
jgi:hypothetical protein